MKRKHDSGSEIIITAAKQQKIVYSYAYNLCELICDLINANKDVAKLFFEKYIDNYMDFMSLAGSDTQILRFLNNNAFGYRFKPKHNASANLIWKAIKHIGSNRLISMFACSYTGIRHIPEVINYLFKHDISSPLAHSLQKDAKYKRVHDLLLLNACKYDGWSIMVEKLLKMKTADPAVYNNVCLRVASQNGLTKVVKLLLDDGRVDPSVNDNEVFKDAYKNKHFGVAALLYPHIPMKLQNDPDPANECGKENYIGLCRALMQIKRK